MWTHTQVEGAGGDLQGRVGMVRVRRSGLMDIVFFTSYAPSGSKPAMRAVRDHLLAWLRERMVALPESCEVFWGVDANARLGSQPASDYFGHQHVGSACLEQENANGTAWKRWAISSRLQFVSTLQVGGAGPFWSGGSLAASRIAYVLMRACRRSIIDRCWVGHRAAVQLQLSGSWRWIDQAPVCVTFRYRAWFDGSAEHDPVRLNREQVA